jgi:hypothetical protein
MRDLALRLAVLGAVIAPGTRAPAQPVPADLTAPPVVPTSYRPAKTAWGDPDFSATWTGDRASEIDIPRERPAEMGSRAWLTEAEFAKRLEAAEKSDAGYQEDVDASGTVGLARWARSSPFARRSSQIVSPRNGRLPPLTPRAQALFEAGHSSWNKGQAIDWVADLDSFDRCISRGFPMSMLPRANNNGIRIFQSPGFVAFQLEILGTRVIPIGHGRRWPAPVRAWLGQGLGHWEGNTLVIETRGIVAGDGASGHASKQAAPPISVERDGIIPTSDKATTIERLTMTGPDTMVYEVTYSDPDVFTAPWTVAVEWQRDDKYRLYEFACHEGNEVRELISSSRAQRKKDARLAATKAEAKAPAAH